MALSLLLYYLLNRYVTLSGHTFGVTSLFRNPPQNQGVSHFSYFFLERNFWAKAFATNLFNNHY